MVNPQLRPRLLATAIIAVALILGGLAGATFDRAFFRPSFTARSATPADLPEPTPRNPNRPRTRYLDQLTRELDLTEAQRAQVDSLLRMQHERLRELRRETRARSAKIVEETRAEIFQILTPEQQETLRQRQASQDTMPRPAGARRPGLGPWPLAPESTER